MKNYNCKKLGKVFAGVGVPLFIIGAVAAAFSPTFLVVLFALLGLAISGIAVILLSGMFDS